MMANRAVVEAEKARILKAVSEIVFIPEIAAEHERAGIVISDEDRIASFRAHVISIVAG
jgi:hypothetical protein